MFEAVNFKIRNNNFLLYNTRCIFWQEKKTLILSDIHLGKAGHFRKNGIAIPQTVFKADMHKFVSQIQYNKPSSIIIVGDMFHSQENKEHDFFLKWRNDFPNLEIHLVKGNHDILKDNAYSKANIVSHKKNLSIDGFSFTHDINECTDNEDYCFSGHIHPGIYINGTARQSLKVPCFYFTKDFAVLPAFGNFTGVSPVKPDQGDTIFAITGDSIIRFYG